MRRKKIVPNKCFQLEFQLHTNGNGKNGVEVGGADESE